MRPLILFLLLFSILLLQPTPAGARNKDKISYGEGLIVNIPLPESEVEQVVEDIAQNGLIRGTKEYNKDEFVAGAKESDTSRVFPAWDQPGKVFYKVRLGAIDPLNFKDVSDVGTLVVRYVVLPQGDRNTVLRIDALFEEDFRHVVHQSNGSVESAEYKDIREHLDSIELMKSQNIEAEKERQERIARKRELAGLAQNVQGDEGQTSSSKSSQQLSSSVESDSSSAQASTPQSNSNPPEYSSRRVEVPSSESSDQTPLSSATPLTLEERVKELRKQVQRLVKAPGAPLKSAPFHTASTLQLLTTGTEVLILISTPYWYGVETHDGQHGWMMRDQLETP